MCVPQAMMLTTMASTVASISAGNAQAKATREAGLIRNEQIERDKELADLQAKELESQRLIDYNNSVSRNLVMSAFAGRSATDASNIALMEANYETIQNDIRSLTIQRNAVNKKYRTMAQTNLVDTTQRATASERMGLLTGVSTMAEGLYKIREIE